jgi:acyl transferase domain-containing protein
MSSVIFLFSGQGAQYYQMGAELYYNDPAYRQAFDYCAEIVGDIGGYSLIESVFRRPTIDSDGYDDLEETNLALLAQGYATVKSLNARGIWPDALAGYSLGELTAAIVSGGITLEQAMRMIQAQSRHVKQTVPKAAMIAILSSPSLILESQTLSRLCEIACINSPQHFVATASLMDVDRLTNELNQREISWARLPVNFGFHSSLLDTAESGYSTHAHRVEFQKPSLPVYSSLSAARINRYDPDYFWQVARGVLRFRDLVTNLWAAEPRIFVDCSPTGTLASFIRQTLGNSIPTFTAMNRFGRNLDTLTQIETALRAQQL